MIRVGDRVRVCWRDPFDRKIRPYFGKVISKTDWHYSFIANTIKVYLKKTDTVIICYPHEISKLATLCA